MIDNHHDQQAGTTNARAGSVSRRSALGLVAGAALAVPMISSPATAAADTHRGTPAPQLASLERKYGTRLGVHAVNLHTGRRLSHRAGDTFPILSVFKPLAAAALLRDHDHHGELLRRRIFWTSDDVVENSPVTSEHVADGLPVADLCAAAITRSDNTAGNLILRLIGGPAAVTRFARSIGDSSTRLDRWEPDLNSAVPGDRRDTTTPLAIATSYARLALGQALAPGDRWRLLTWLLANQTSTQRFGAGVPTGWPLADKTGAGSYGSLNDVGVTWTPAGAPIVMAALSVTADPGAVADPGVMAETAQIVTARLG
jgi:beta-lactamase class A